MKTVFIYAGQGSQREKMGMDIYEKYDEYKEILDNIKLDFDVKELMHSDDLDTLSQTKYTQPCMAAFAVGVTEILKNNGIEPDAACGLSLGEYGALYSAGVMSGDDYISTVAYRGKVMDEASKEHICSMSAILGLESYVVEEVCNECSKYGYVTLVNYNCPGQYVISGDDEAVGKAEELLKEKGAKRCVRLNVSGPFHTKYMSGPAKKLSEYLENVEFNKPIIPVVMNVTGDFYDGESDMKGILEKQVQCGVRFEESIEKLIESGAERFVEIGPGSTLSGFVKKTARKLGKKVETFNIDTVNDLENVIECCKN